MAGNRKGRIREDRQRAAWYGVAQVEDQNFVHHKSSPFGRNFEGDCADIVVPLQPEDTGVKENHTALRLIGKIILFLIAGALLACMIAGLYQQI